MITDALPNQFYLLPLPTPPGIYSSQSISSGSAGLTVDAWLNSTRKRFENPAIAGKYAFLSHESRLCAGNSLTNSMTLHPKHRSWLDAIPPANPKLEALLDSETENLFTGESVSLEQESLDITNGMDL